MSIGSLSSSDSFDDDRSPGERVLWIVLALLLVLLLGIVGAWFLGWFRPRLDPRVREIRALQRAAVEKYAETGGPANLAEAAEAVVAMQQVREKVEALPENLRTQVEGGGMRQFMQARVTAYFTASPEDRTKILDRHIDQEELIRKAFEAARRVAEVATGEAGGGAGGAAAGGGSGTAAGGEGGSGNAPRGGSGGPGGGGGGFGGGFGGGPPRNGTEEDRNKWRKQMIDRTSPDQRARYSEYRRVMEQRRAQRGLPTGPGR